MTKEEKKKISLARAKRTAFGRFLCRLLGDNAGQTMMEYVVIGVMIVAAAVAIVLLFGKQIRENFAQMIRRMQGDTTQTLVKEDPSSAISNDGINSGNGGGGGPGAGGGGPQ